MKTMNENFEELLSAPDFMAYPYPVLRAMREQEPVYWSESIGGWLLTRYDDVLVSFKNTAVFSNENRLTKTVEYLPVEKQKGFKAVVDHYATKGLIHSDPPDHTRLRGLVNREFTPKVVDQMRPRIQDVVDGLLDAVEAKGEMDVVPEFSTPLPMGVIAEILGVPAPDRHLLREWTDLIIGFQGVNKPSEDDLSKAQIGLNAMRPYIKGMIEERRRQPKQDLMSKLVALETAGERISEPELISTCVTLIIAGHETTLSLISNMIYLLLSHPAQLQRLRENPELLDPAIEEALRYESPVSRQARLLKEDIELGGKLLKKGDIAFQMLNAANRDPQYFDDPEIFDMERKKNRHIAFGQGAHFCVGAMLARAEANIAVGTILRRFPKLRLVDRQPDWDLGKRTSRMLRTLKVAF